MGVHQSRWMTQSCWKYHSLPLRQQSEPLPFSCSLPSLLALVITTTLARDSLAAVLPNVPANKATLQVGFPANIRSAFDETGDAGFLPVTGNSKTDNNGAMEGPLAPTTPSRVLILRAKRDAGDEVDLDDEGSGEEPPLVVTNPPPTTQPPTTAAPTTPPTTPPVTTPPAPSTPAPTKAPTTTPPTTTSTTTMPPPPPSTREGTVPQEIDTLIEDVTVDYGESRHNATTESGFKKSSVRYAIIMGAIILFWILLAPIVCLFCRYRDNQKNKSEKQHQQVAQEALTEFQNQDLTRAPGDAKKPPAHTNGNVPSQNPGTPKLNGSAPHSGSPVANGKVPADSPPSYTPLPEDIQFIDEEDDVWVPGAQHDAYDIVHLKDSKV